MIGFNPGRWALLLALVVALVFGIPVIVHRYNDGLREEGRAECREAMTAKALQEHETKAAEGLRRIQQQEKNQHAQDAEVARLRNAAARNAADADRVREQSADAARQWSARLADSPSAEDLAAAGAAIAVCTDVRGRLDQAAGVLAAYAGSARAAGLKCERDYDALKR